MTSNKTDQNNKKPSNVRRGIAQENFKDKSESSTGSDGKMVINQSDKQTLITQSCATPPRPKR